MNPKQAELPVFAKNEATLDSKLAKMFMSILLFYKFLRYLFLFFRYKISSGQAGSSKTKPIQAELPVLAKNEVTLDNKFAKIFK